MIASNPRVPYYRPLSKGDTGVDVLCLRTALIRCGYLKATTPAGRNSRYLGIFMARALGRAQKAAKLPVTNTYGPNLHRFLARKRKDKPLGCFTEAGAARLRELVNARNIHARQLRVAAWALKSEQQKPKIGYSQSASRAGHWGALCNDPTRGRDRDCSSQVTEDYYCAGEPDPSRFDYRAIGWTKTLADGGTPVSSIEVGDLLFNGAYPYTHVIIAVGRGWAVSHGRSSGPELRSETYRPVTAIRRYIT